MSRSDGQRLWQFTVAGLAAGCVAVAVTGAAVAIADTTQQQYTGCLKNGQLSNVAIGTQPSSQCPNGATVIQWNQTGPQGPQGPQGVQGVQGPQGVPGPAGPGAIYVADNTNGTMDGSVNTPDTLATAVGGFHVGFTCEPSEVFDTADVDVTLPESNTTATSVNYYASALTPGSTGPSSGSVTGTLMHQPLQIATIDNIGPGTTSELFAQGFIVANAGGIVSQPEQGFWYSLYMTFHLNQTSGGLCTVTGTLVPISGDRSVTRIIIQP